MSLTQRVLGEIIDRRNRILSGKVNCIPSPFKTFRYDFPGTELNTYYLVSGAAKSSKSKVTNFLFVFNNILYAYHHPELVRIKIFYVLLEETPETIFMKFMCYLLYIMDGIRVDIKTLKSIDEGRIVRQEVIEQLRTLQYQSILNFFENHVEFIPDRNPTGIYKAICKYANAHGTIHRKKIEGFDREVFDYYTPNDKDEYVEVITDHVGLLELEKSYDIRLTIKKHSEYSKLIRDRFNYIPINVQQQNSETLSLDAFKANKIRPTQKGLLDSQDCARDCNVFLGITNPFAFEIPDYLHYSIVHLKDCARFLEVVLGRDGISNSILPMYFDGAVGYYAPLPPSSNTAELNKVYNLIERNRASQSK